MNISIINSLDIGGGAEKVNFQLNEYYNRKGHNSTMYVGRRLSNSKDVIEIENEKYENSWVKVNKTLSRKTKYPFNNLFKIIGIPNWRSAIMGREPMYYPATKNLIFSKDILPDIIHLSNLHGKYFDLRQIPIISREIPTVLRLSDMWMFTGHCAHSMGCELWKNGCGNCPDLTLYPSLLRDGTKSNHSLKKRIYKKSKLFISTPSKWLMEKVKQSILQYNLAESRIIPTGVDQTFFKPSNKNLLRRNKGIDLNKMVIIVYASGHKAYKWGGISNFLNIIEDIFEDKYETIIYVIGHKDCIKKSNKIEIRYMSHIDDSNEYLKYIQLSDVYVHLSRADTYPNAILEALSCGIPAVAYEVGGIPEQIIPFNHSSNYFVSDKKPTGALVPNFDSKQMAIIIEKLVTNNKLRLQISKNAILYSKQNFNFEIFAKSYLSWYSEIIDSTQV